MCFAASFWWLPLLLVAAGSASVALGLLPRTLSAVEPAWVAEDVEIILEEQERRDGLCKCGHPRVEAWDIEADEFERYEGELWKCHACGAGAGAEKAFTSGEHEADTGGLYTVIRDTWEDGRPPGGDDG